MNPVFRWIQYSDGNSIQHLNTRCLKSGQFHVYIQMAYQWSSKWKLTKGTVTLSSSYPDSYYSIYLVTVSFTRAFQLCAKSVLTHYFWCTKFAAQTLEYVYSNCIILDVILNTAYSGQGLSLALVFRSLLSSKCAQWLDYNTIQQKNKFLFLSVTFTFKSVTF